MVQPVRAGFGNSYYPGFHGRPGILKADKQVPERIYKLQPNRTIQLRGFNDLGAAAALHSATETGFKVSGVFRDPADFCVLTLYDCDNFFEHPSLKYLPDTNFDGLTLSFDVHYTGLRNLDSPLYPIIDWPFLDVIRPDGTTASVHLFDENALVSGTWTAATANFTVVADRPRQWDRLTLWYLNRAFDYLVPQVSCAYAFSPAGEGTVHSIVVGGDVFSLTELAGESEYSLAARMVAALASCPLVEAKVGDGSPELGWANQVNLRAKVDDGVSFQVSASGTQSEYKLTGVGPNSIAAELVRQCNQTGWDEVGGDIALTAAAVENVITFTAARPGVDGNGLAMYAVSKNPRLTTLEPLVQFSGGSSDATWHVSVDFKTAGIPDVRKMWLTFAPPLSPGRPFEATEWEAVFTNWTLTGPEEVRRLQVAGPGSQRIEESSTLCTYLGNWTSEYGFFSQAYAQVSKAAGNTIRVRYVSEVEHQLWIGTSLYGDRGAATVCIDGGVGIPFNTYLKTDLDPAVITRRRIGSATLPAGDHTIVIRTADAKPFYFDYLDIVAPSDVPDSLPARKNISPALDYSTDHTYKLPPARILWMFDKLGFAGPMNEYIGVFWWNQRTRIGAVLPQATVTFTGTFSEGDQLWLEVSGVKVSKTVLSTDTTDTIALHFACYLSETFVGLWARAEGNVLTITSHSPTTNFQFDLSKTIELKPDSTGIVTIEGALRCDRVQPGMWHVDLSQTPPLNRGALDWHADFFRECKAHNRELVVASSMELVLPPDELPARYQDGTPVKTSVGYGSDWWSSHCAFNAPMLAFQKQVFHTLAGLMDGAGLTPEIQFGEYCWWYFPSEDGASMAFYDDDTRAAAETALGRPLARFRTATDDPAANNNMDAQFLRTRLRNHVAALIADIRAAYPNARFEVLFPYDVNYPVPAGVGHIGGRLLRYINFPSEWEQKETSGFDRLKMEGLDWGAVSRDLDLVRDVLEFPVRLGWPLDSVRYMMPVFNGGCPWLKEYRMTKEIGIPFVNMWAFDHVCIFGLPVAEPAQPARAVRF